MGRYTANDNRSMQCNPNNERYHSSRGYSDDDEDDGYEESSFNRTAWEKERSIEFQESKEILDASSIEIFGKKVIFLRSNYHRASYLAMNKEHLFELVLKERESLKEFVFKEKNQKGLTVSFKSFKNFLEETLDFSTLEEEQVKLEENKVVLEEKYNLYLMQYRDEKLKEEIIKLGRIRDIHSFNFIRDILKEDSLISKRVKSNYIFFDRVCISDSYMIFELDIRRQGSYLPCYESSWHFALDSYDICLDSAPEVVYENFEDVFTCKKYLVDL